MTDLDRRKFLQLAGTTSAVAAGAAVLPVAGSLAWTGANTVRFRAVTGLPGPPLPASASYVITGQVDLAARTGSVTTALHAGRPDAMSATQFPGLTRKIRITTVTTTASGVLHISGRVMGTSRLRPGETRTVELSIDRRAHRVRANFLGDEVMLDLQHGVPPTG